MKDYLVEVNVDGIYTTMINVQEVKSVDLIDDFTILINDDVKIQFDRAVLSIRRIMEE